MATLKYWLWLSTRKGLRPEHSVKNSCPAVGRRRYRWKGYCLEVPQIPVRIYSDRSIWDRAGGHLCGVAKRRRGNRAAAVDAYLYRACNLAAGSFSILAWRTAGSMRGEVPTA